MRTPAMTTADALALLGLLQGRWDSWRCDEHHYSAGGIAVDGTDATSVIEAVALQFQTSSLKVDTTGTQLNTFALTRDLTGGAAACAAIWVDFNDLAGPQHVVFTTNQANSQTVYVNGVVYTDPVGFAGLATTALDTTYLEVYPAVLSGDPPADINIGCIVVGNFEMPASLVTAIYGHDIAPSPQLWMGGDLLTEGTEILVVPDAPSAALAVGSSSGTWSDNLRVVTFALTEVLP